MRKLFTIVMTMSLLTTGTVFAITEKECIEKGGKFSSKCTEWLCGITPFIPSSSVDPDSSIANACPDYSTPTCNKYENSCVIPKKTEVSTPAPTTSVIVPNATIIPTPGSTVVVPANPGARTTITPTAPASELPL